jgi:hypothetical protein
MRKMRMLIATCFVLIVTPMLMGARSITWSVTPNPGGVLGKIQAGGSYTIDMTDTFVVVNYETANMQLGKMYSGADGAGGGTWSCTLTVPAGPYSPNKATLYYKDANGNLGMVPSSIGVVYTVN